MNDESKFKRPKMRRHPRLVFRRISRTWPFFVWLGVAILAAWLYTGSVQFGSMTGVIETLAEDVAPLEAARILSLEVQVGQEVEAGDIVARMDTSVVDAEIAVEEAIVVEAEAAVSTYQQDVMQMATRLNSAIRQAEFDLESLKIQDQRERAELAALEEELKRREQLLADRMIRAEDVNNLRPQIAALRSAVESYPSLIKVHERNLANTRKERKQLDDWMRIEPGEDISSSIERWMTSREAVFDSTRKMRNVQRETYNLRTTRGGIVSRIDRRPGEVVAAGEAILRLVQSSSDTIIGFLPESYIHDLSVNQKVLVWSHGSEIHRTTAVVESISPDVQALPGRVSPIRGQTVRGRRVIMRMKDSTGMIPGETVQIRLGGSRLMLMIRNLLHGTEQKKGSEERNARN